MADDRVPDEAIPPARCPWCSAPLASTEEISCPSCGATLISDTEQQLPGVTAIDAEAIVRGARGATPQRRSRLLSWISGDVEAEEPTVPGSPESLAPPPLDVKREILRMELEAEISDLRAEAGAILAEEGAIDEAAGVARQPLDAEGLADEAAAPEPVATSPEPAVAGTDAEFGEGEKGEPRA